MGFTRVIDFTAEPVLEVQFEIASDHLSVWVRAERKPDIWAKQRLVHYAPVDWRLSDPCRAHWQNFAGEEVTVTAKLNERPGLDSQLKRIGPALALARHRAVQHAPTPAQAAANQLLKAVKRHGFAARSTRGGIAYNQSYQRRYRERSRQGYTRKLAVSRTDRDLLCFTRTVNGDVETFLILY